MPSDDAGTLDVGDQFYDRLGQIPGQSPLWDLPHLDRTVLRTAGYDIIVVGTESNIQYWALVSINNWLIHFHTASLKYFP